MSGWQKGVILQILYSHKKRQSRTIFVEHRFNTILEGAAHRHIIFRCAAPLKFDFNHFCYKYLWALHLLMLQWAEKNSRKSKMNLLL
jgi:hypothetical protein